MIWWITQAGRAQSERLAIAELLDRADWLHDVKWRVTSDVALCADFEIEHLGSRIALSIIYPNFFPDTAPQVKPQSPDTFLSGHQYGAGGELCLEIRPENWEPNFTGAMMVESAYRLLSGEQPSQEESGEVASDHRMTIGQIARGNFLRFLLPENAFATWSDLPPYSLIDAEIVEYVETKVFVAHPKSIGPKGAVLWENHTQLPQEKLVGGYFIRLDPDLSMHIAPNYDFLHTLLGPLGHSTANEKLAESKSETMFIIQCGARISLMCLAAGAGSRLVHNYKTIPIPAEKQRLPETYVKLSNASVAIVGCGSIGSKVAASLARAGVKTFTLVDGDLLLPDNLVRNELSWRSVGLNKPDALAARIRDIRPNAEITLRRIALGGQESSATTDSTLTAIGECDVIVEATANADVFNLCGSVARRENKPLIWGEVFAGGIGGIVARSRPSIDPVPHAARRQIATWCADRETPAPSGQVVRYGIETTDNLPPLIADDTDVGFIANSISRMAIDLLAGEQTVFPQSAYAVGIKPGWIFTAPFDTWPIQLVPEGNWGEHSDPESQAQLNDLIEELFPKPDTETTGAT